MKKADKKVFKERLLSLRSRLRGDVTAMADSALRKNRQGDNGDLSSMPIHMAELGSENFDQEFTLSIMATEEGTLNAIEKSLERIEDGDYGKCGALRPEDFEKVLGFTERKIVELAEEILSGKIDVQPYRLSGKSPCSFCDYKPICRFDWQINDYNFLESIGKRQVLEQIEGKIQKGEK